MSEITLAQAAAWCGGQIDPRFAGTVFLGACHDSRLVQPGQLFVALPGQRDGHDFMESALARGAGAVLCTHCTGTYPAIVVPDTRLALGQLARKERERLNCRVIGVTGSVGKSTTKEMIAAVLRQKYPTGKTPVNHNNDIGMPMGILSLPANTQAAVLEMGMNHFGELSYLTSIAQPDIGVITNIGTAHIAYLGSREGILQAKLEMLEGLRPGGRTVFLADEPLLWALQRPDTVYFGLENPACEIYGTDLQEENGVSRVTVDGYRLTIPVEGVHLVRDALAAVAVGRLMDLRMEEIQAGLSSYRSMEGRQRIVQRGGYTVMEDFYNAGPESMAASLNVLAKKPGKRIAILGDMLEQGDYAPESHAQVGRQAAACCDLLLCLGSQAECMARSASSAGLQQALAFSTAEELTQTLRSLAVPGDTLLVKGSRGMKMERVLTLFFGEET